MGNRKNSILNQKGISALMSVLAVSAVTSVAVVYMITKQSEVSQFFFDKKLIQERDRVVQKAAKKLSEKKICSLFFKDQFVALEKGGAVSFSANDVSKKALVQSLGYSPEDRLVVKLDVSKIPAKELGSRIDYVTYRNIDSNSSADIDYYSRKYHVRLSTESAKRANGSLKIGVADRIFNSLIKNSKSGVKSVESEDFYLVVTAPKSDPAGADCYLTSEFKLADGTIVNPLEKKCLDSGGLFDGFRCSLRAIETDKTRSLPVDYLSSNFRLTDALCEVELSLLKRQSTSFQSIYRKRKVKVLKNKNFNGTCHKDDTWSYENKCKSLGGSFTAWRAYKRHESYNCDYKEVVIEEATNNTNPDRDYGMTMFCQKPKWAGCVDVSGKMVSNNETWSERSREYEKDELHDVVEKEILQTQKLKVLRLLPSEMAKKLPDSFDIPKNFGMEDAAHNANIAASAGSIYEKANSRFKFTPETNFAGTFEKSQYEIVNAVKNFSYKILDQAHTLDEAKALVKANGETFVMNQIGQRVPNDQLMRILTTSSSFEDAKVKIKSQVIGNTLVATANYIDSERITKTMTKIVQNAKTPEEAKFILAGDLLVYASDPIQNERYKKALTKISEKAKTPEEAKAILAGETIAYSINELGQRVHNQEISDVLNGSNSIDDIKQKLTNKIATKSMNYVGSKAVKAGQIATIMQTSKSTAEAKERIELLVARKGEKYILTKAGEYYPEENIAEVLKTSDSFEDAKRKIAILFPKDSPEAVEEDGSSNLQASAPAGGTPDSIWKDDASILQNIKNLKDEIKSDTQKAIEDLKQGDSTAAILLGSVVKAKAGEVAAKVKTEAINKAKSALNNIGISNSTFDKVSGIASDLKFVYDLAKNTHGYNRDDYAKTAAIMGVSYLLDVFGALCPPCKLASFILKAALPKLVTRMYTKGCNNARYVRVMTCQMGQPEIKAIEWEVQKISWKGLKRRCNWGKTTGKVNPMSDKDILDGAKANGAFDYTKYVNTEIQINEDADESDNEVLNFFNGIKQTNSLSRLYFPDKENGEVDSGIDDYRDLSDEMRKAILTKERYLWLDFAGKTLDQVETIDTKYNGLTTVAQVQQSLADNESRFAKLDKLYKEYLSYKESYVNLKINRSSNPGADLGHLMSKIEAAFNQGKSLMASAQAGAAIKMEKIRKGIN